MPKEPQSYGSNAEWVTGNTGQKVNDPNAAPPPSQSGFYDERREPETNHESQGGETIAEYDTQSTRGAVEDAGGSATGVNTSEGGAKRGSFFKDRDYAP